MATTPHIRLAIVSTSGGDIVSITDCRGGHNIVVPYAAGGIRRSIEAHTTNDALTMAESGSVHTNLGGDRHGDAHASRQCCSRVLNSPSPCRQHAELRVAPGTAAIRDSSGQTAGKYKSAGGHRCESHPGCGLQWRLDRRGPSRNVDTGTIEHASNEERRRTMAHEIQADYVSGSMLYAIIRNPAGQVWRPAEQSIRRLGHWQATRSMTTTSP